MNTRDHSSQHHTIVPTAWTDGPGNGRSYTVIDRHRDGRFWTWVERLRGHQDGLIQEKFISEIEWTDPEIIRWFHSSHPHSQDFLLHYLASPVNTAKNPVLLIHGAGQHANLSWGESIHKKKGLLFPLATTGRDIYAVTFAHPHGDNRLQAIQLANAIKRIQEVSSVEKIDIIAHSKGGIVAWTYLSGMVSQTAGAYQGGVQHCLLLGSPNGGLDFPFRHLSPNWMAKREQISAPLACDSMLYFGRYIDTTEQSLYRDGGAFPGSAQLLVRWDDRFPISPHTRTLYEGGQNLLLHSRGIETAIRDGGNYMAQLFKAPIDPQVNLHLLAGHSSYFNGICTEYDGPSDGLVFVDSALHEDGIVSDPQQIIRKTSLPLNHLELLYHPTAHQWVVEGLEESRWNELATS